MAFPRWKQDLCGGPKALQACLTHVLSLQPHRPPPPEMREEALERLRKVVWDSPGRRETPLHIRSRR
jgi:hypothetical protein